MNNATHVLSTIRKYVLSTIRKYVLSTIRTYVLSTIRKLIRSLSTRYSNTKSYSHSLVLVIIHNT